MLVEGIAETPIPARKVPDDFPSGLPAKPPTVDEIYQILELWDNVIEIARLNWEQWEDKKRCDYMIWILNNGSQYRVIWDEDRSAFRVSLRRS